MSGITLEYKKLRKHFGRTVNHFSDSNFGVLCDIPRNEHRLKEFQERVGKKHNGNETELQSTHSINTLHVKKVSKATLHLEGGWPKDITILQRIEQVDQKNRFVKRIEKSDLYQNELKNLSGRTTRIIEQNNSLNMYEEYFSKSGEVHNLSLYKNEDIESGEKKKYDFEKISSGSKNINNIMWTGKGGRIEEFEFTCIKVHPVNENIVVGGDSNGNMEFFDFSKGLDKLKTGKGHLGMIRDIHWIKTKNGIDRFLTISDDSTLCLWEMDTIEDGPVQKMDLVFDQVTYKPNCLDVSQRGDKNKIMIGTKSGEILQIELNKNLMEEGSDWGINSKFKVFKQEFSNSIIQSVKVNPVFPEIFLSLSGWNIKIWNSGMNTTPLFETQNEMSYIFDAEWDQKLAPQLYSVNGDGRFEKWDLSVNQKEPVVSKKITKCELLKIVMFGRDNKIGVVDEKWNTYIIRNRERILQDMEEEKKLEVVRKRYNVYFKKILNREVEREILLGNEFDGVLELPEEVVEEVQVVTEEVIKIEDNDNEEIVEEVVKVDLPKNLLVICGSRFVGKSSIIKLLYVFLSLLTV